MVINNHIGILNKVTDCKNVISVILAEGIGAFSFCKYDFCKLPAFGKPFQIGKVLKKVTGKVDFLKFGGWFEVFEAFKGGDEIVGGIDFEEMGAFFDSFERLEFVVSDLESLKAS